MPTPSIDYPWQRLKRRAKLTPETVQKIYVAYLEILHERGIKATAKIKMRRHSIATAIGEQFNLHPTHVTKVLSRTSWGEQPLPDDWIPFI